MMAKLSFASEQMRADSLRNRGTLLPCCGTLRAGNDLQVGARSLVYRLEGDKKAREY